MTEKKSMSSIYSYQASVVFVGIFYLILVSWIVFCLAYLETVFNNLGLSIIAGYVMISFVVIATCYFALGISYRIEVGDNGLIRLTSFRRTIETSTEVIFTIEGPRVPIGFIRFRLEREKAYLFYVANNAAMETVLNKIRMIDTDINFKHMKVFEKK